MTGFINVLLAFQESDQKHGEGPIPPACRLSRMSEWGERVIEYLLELGNAGCQGNAQDYSAWMRYVYSYDVSPDSLHGCLESMVQDGRFKTHPDIPSEYMVSDVPQMPARIEYTVSGDLDHAPLQMVRSRLEAFLRSHGATESEIIDVSIATTEAMENAVKYSDHQKIELAYQILDQVFDIRIVNRIGNVEPEQDIESGKYSGSLTLMRGMMVMVKLFDEMDIDISEEQQTAIFTAHKKLGS